MSFKIGEQVKVMPGVWDSLEGLIGVIFKTPTYDKNYYGVNFQRRNTYEASSWYFHEVDLQSISPIQYYYAI